MKMAKPSEKDIHAADDLCLILSIVDSSLSRFNGDFVDDDIPDLFTLYDNDCFDETNMLHLQALFNKLANLIYRNPAFYHRVIGGMCHVIMYSENQIIDPDSDTIDLHPRFQEMYEYLLQERKAARYWNKRYHETEQKLQLYKNNAIAYECTCIQCKKEFFGEKEQHFCFKCLLNEMDNLREERNRFVAETERLDGIINSPQKDDFIRAVSTEAEHQRQRWGTSHDSGKTPADWFWLVGYLAGKALHHQASGNTEKAEHHMITAAAACANWHKAMFGKTDMRPGIDGEAAMGNTQSIEEHF